MSHPLPQRIESLTSRLCRRAWLTGWAGVAVIALNVALVLGVLDYITRLSDPGVRWLATGVWLGAIGWTLYHLLFRPDAATHRPTTIQVAGQIENRFPQLGSRLSSALEFSNQAIDDPQAGSSELRRAVVVETTSEVEQLELDEVVDPKPLRNMLQLAAWSVGMFGLLAILQPAAVGTGITRLMAPWSDAAWPRRHELAFVDPPNRIARGQTFEVALVDRNGTPPVDAKIEYRTSNGRKESQPLQPVGDQLIATRDNVQRAFAYRAVGGDDFTMPWTEVEVVDPPKVVSLEITSQPPAYSGLPGETLESDVRILSGTELTFNATLDKPVDQAKLEIGSGDNLRTVAVEVEADNKLTASLRLTEDLLAEENAGKPLSTTYRLRLESADGLVGYSSRHRLRVEPDLPPTVEWQAPTGDTFVVATATVPLVVAVSDNLAIKQAAATAELSSDSALPDQTPITLSLYESPDQPPARDSAALDVLADVRTVEYDWDLAELKLSPGYQLSVMVNATDYRPGTGETRLPRRIVIISPEELDARLADAQTNLLRDLQRALSAQRESRDQTEEVANQTQAKVDQAALDRLATLGFEQRQVETILIDPARGAAQQADELLNQLTANDVDRPELQSQLQRVRDELLRLGDRPLPEAARGVNDARRSAGDLKRDGEQPTLRERLSESLASATGNQEEVIETLEQLTEEMAEWSDLQQFVQELAELEKRQQELQKKTITQAAKEAAKGRDAPENQAEREKLAATQADLSRRFDRLMRAMQKRLGEETATSEPSLAPVADTLAEAEEKATGGKLRQAQRQMQQGQLGRASQQQQQASEDLKELLDTLRDRAASDPKELAKQLEESQKKIAELEKQLEQLAQEPNDAQNAEDQKRLAEKAERLSRKLEKQTADAASESTKQASDKLSQSAGKSGESGKQQQQNQKQAQQDSQQQLAKAKAQVEQRINELKNEVAQRVLDKLAAEIDGYIDRQKLLIEETILLNDQALPDPDRQLPASELAGEQRQLEQAIAAAARELADRKVFANVLGRAIDQMSSAAGRLEQADAGRPTQRFEASALQRLKQIAAAVKPNPDQPDEPPQPPPGDVGQGGQPPPPQPPPPFDVAELKMLRIMQLDLNARTRNFEAQVAESRSDGDAAGRDAVKLGSELAAEQNELAELVEELINRNNQPEPEVKPGEVF